MKSPEYVASPLAVARWAITATTLLAGIAIVVCANLHKARSAALGTSSASFSEPLKLPTERLGGVSIARMNLLCAQGLSASNDPDITASLARLETWAEHVRSETARHEYRFRKDPTQFQNSDGFFRMLMLAVVLAEDFNVHYSPERKTQPAEARLDDGFFAKPEDVFLHGLLGQNRQGTCSSMPVLYVAVGRQLGYPLKLVTTKGHMFVRWDGNGERFNVEATARGLSCFDDEYYRHWPFEVTPAEEAANGYLKSLTAPEELAAFLSIRGMCLHESHRLAEAAQAFADAVRLAPACHAYQAMHATVQAEAERTALLAKHQKQSTYP